MPDSRFQITIPSAKASVYSNPSVVRRSKSGRIAAIIGLSCIAMISLGWWMRSKTEADRHLKPSKSLTYTPSRNQNLPFEAIKKLDVTAWVSPFGVGPESALNLTIYNGSSFTLGELELELRVVGHAPRKYRRVVYVAALTAGHEYSIPLGIQISAQDRWDYSLVSASGFDTTSPGTYPFAGYDSSGNPIPPPGFVLDKH